MPIQQVSNTEGVPVGKLKKDFFPLSHKTSVPAHLNGVVVLVNLDAQPEAVGTGGRIAIKTYYVMFSFIFYTN